MVAVTRPSAPMRAQLVRRVEQVPERGGERAGLVRRRDEQALAPARQQPLEPGDHARDDRAAAAHRLEQDHAEAGALAGRAEHVGRGVVARAVPVDAPRPVHRRGDLGRELRSRSSGAAGRRPTTHRRTCPSRARHSWSKASSMMPRPLRGSKRPRNSTTGSPLSRRASIGCARRREVVLVDAVRDHAPVELGEVVVERLDAGVRDDDVTVQPAQRGPRGRVHEVAQAPGREDRVVRADADRPLREHERREHEEARVVGRVDVHDVELPRGEESPQLQRGRAGTPCAASASRCRRAAARGPCARARRRRPRARARRGRRHAARAARGPVTIVTSCPRAARLTA